MGTNKTRFQYIERLKTMSMEHDQQKAEIKETIDFLASEDTEGNQITLSFLQECKDQIGAAQAALDSAIRCLTQ
jgi:hypothetical protein